MPYYMVMYRQEQRGPGGPVGTGLRFEGPTPSGTGKGGPLVKILILLSLKWGLNFPSGLGLLPALHGPGEVYVFKV